MKLEQRAFAYEEESSSEDAVVGELVEVELQKNCHGAATLAVAQFCDDTYNEEHGNGQAFGRFANAVLLYFLGSGIQCVLVALLFLFSEERMQDPYEKIGTKNLIQDLQSAMRNGTALPESDTAVHMCLQDHSVPWSQSMLTFVWLCKCMPAIVNAAWGSIVFLSLPQTGSNIQSKMGKLHITSLPVLGKFIIIFFVQLPLLALDIALAIVGMKFLMYCNALGTLIVKAMSLSYIDTVSGVVFAGLASKTFQLEVNKAFVVCEFKKTPILQIDSWLSGFCKIAVIVFVTLWYCRVKHRYLQDFRLECFQYKYQFIFPNCGSCGLDFFGFHLAN